MVTIEEFAVIAAATALGLLGIYAFGYALFAYYAAHRDARAELDEAARRQDMGNDLNTTIIHNGRG